MGQPLTIIQLDSPATQWIAQEARRTGMSICPPIDLLWPRSGTPEGATATLSRSGPPCWNVERGRG